MDNSGVLASLKTALQGASPDCTAQGCGAATSKLQIALHSARKGTWQPVIDAATQGEEILWNVHVTEGWQSMSLREAYLVAQLLKAIGYIGLRDGLAAMRALDMAIIMGAPMDLVETLLVQARPLANEAWASVAASAVDLESRTLTVSKPTGHVLPAMTLNSIPRVMCGDISVEQFQEQYFRKGLPVVICGETESWPARSRWCELSFWMREHGYRTVPVELGRASPAGRKDASWREATMLLGDFVRNHIAISSRQDQGEILPVTPEIAYLAQHSLFNQITELKDHFTVPRYCSAGRLTNINAWFGTASTVTPLHFDTYDNFLTQVAGYKYVRLYAPAETPYLYASTGKEDGTRKSLDRQGNMSAVDVESREQDAFPLFANATGCETILEPGDMLFIPEKWWHYVRSLSTSLSVNFWF